MAGGVNSIGRFAPFNFCYFCGIVFESPKPFTRRSGAAQLEPFAWRHVSPCADNIRKVISPDREAGAVRCERLLPARRLGDLVKPVKLALALIPVGAVLAVVARPVVAPVLDIG